MATNIAYLSLTRFRYREQIRNCAAGQLAPIGPESTLVDSIKTSDQYKDLVCLAKLADNDGLDEAKKRAPVKGHAPQGSWSFFYRWMFAYHQDLYVAYVMILGAAFTLITGIAVSIEIWSFFRTLGYEPWPEILFWALLLAAAAPGLFVVLGRWVVRGACEHALDAGRQVNALLKDMAKGAKPPGDGAQGSPPPSPPPAPAPGPQFQYFVTPPKPRLR